MPLILLTPPGEEPLSLADAKLFLRVDHSDEDRLIASLIRAARAQVEAVSGRRLVAQTWRIVRDQWPEEGALRLPVGPVTAVEAARLRAVDGTAVPIAIGGWTLAGDRLRIAGMPAVLRPFAGIEIDLAVGYGAAADVPPLFVQAIRTLVAHWYEHRTSEVTPPPLAGLLAPEKAVRL